MAAKSCKIWLVLAAVVVGVFSGSIARAGAIYLHRQSRLCQGGWWFDQGNATTGGTSFQPVWTGQGEWVARVFLGRNWGLTALNVYSPGEIKSFEVRIRTVANGMLEVRVDGDRIFPDLNSRIFRWNTEAGLTIADVLSGGVQTSNAYVDASDPSIGGNGGGVATSTTTSTTPTSGSSTVAASLPSAKQSTWLDHLGKTINGDGQGRNIFESVKDKAELETYAENAFGTGLVDGDLPHAGSLQDVELAARQFLSFFYTGSHFVAGSTNGRKYIDYMMRGAGVDDKLLVMSPIIRGFDHWVGGVFNDVFSLVRYFADVLVCIGTYKYVVYRVAWGLGMRDPEMAEPPLPDESDV